MLLNWSAEEGVHCRFEVGKSFTVAYTRSITRQPLPCVVLLLVARMARHKREIHAIQDQMEEDRDATLDALELARGLITYLESRLKDSEAREAVLERRIGAFEEPFGPPGSKQ
ncbi:hypothetical protein Tco_1050558 [Tanacetum coccineum]